MLGFFSAVSSGKPNTVTVLRLLTVGLRPNQNAAEQNRRLEGNTRAGKLPDLYLLRSWFSLDEPVNLPKMHGEDPNHPKPV